MPRTTSWTTTNWAAWHWSTSIRRRHNTARSHAGIYAKPLVVATTKTDRIFFGGIFSNGLIRRSRFCTPTLRIDTDSEITPSIIDGGDHWTQANAKCDLAIKIVHYVAADLSLGADSDRMRRLSRGRTP